MPTENDKQRAIRALQALAVAKLISAAERLSQSPSSQLVGEREIHILTVHHSARRFPGDL